MSVRLAILLSTKISSKVKAINACYITVAISANLYFTLAICTCKNTNIINMSVSMHIYYAGKIVRIISCKKKTE